jgi:hypothetical protein
MKTRIPVLLIVGLTCLSPTADAANLQKKVKDPGSMALYHLTNAPGGWSKYYFDTYVIDDQDLRKQPAPYGRVYMAPGEHTVVVSYRDFSGSHIPFNLKEGVFQGTYTIRFTMKPGMRYAPIFNLNLPKEQQPTQMCMAEVPQSASLGETREPMQYVACAEPSLDPTPENIKTCMENILAATPVVHKEWCTPILPEKK